MTVQIFRNSTLNLLAPTGALIETVVYYPIIQVGTLTKVRLGRAGGCLGSPTAEAGNGERADYP